MQKQESGGRVVAARDAHARKPRSEEIRKLFRRDVAGVRLSYTCRRAAAITALARANGCASRTREESRAAWSMIRKYDWDGGRPNVAGHAGLPFDPCRMPGAHTTPLRRGISLACCFSTFLMLLPHTADRVRRHGLHGAAIEAALLASPFCSFSCSCCFDLLYLSAAKIAVLSHPMPAKTCLSGATAVRHHRHHRAMSPDLPFL